MARVLLLNPPANGRAVLRDFACGESSKADYYWAPIDLLVLSGALAADHDLHVIDAVAESCPPSEALARACSFRPDAVFSLTAAVSLHHDAAFLHRLAAETGARIYGIGDVASFAPEETLRKVPAFDGLVQNFADPSLLRLAGGDDSGVGSGAPRRRPDRRASGAPRRADALRHAAARAVSAASLPDAVHPLGKTTTVLTANGCPFPCTFCASRSLPQQLRPIPDAVAELVAIERLGVREVYVRDFTFGPSRQRGHELCEAMIAAGLQLRWSAECRVDVLDEGLLDAMRRAGCEVILVGIETGDEEVAGRLGKSVKASRTHRVLAHARALGIRSCGHFVLGSPHETRAQALTTIRYARALPLDYASFNLYAPRLGTPLRSELVALGKVQDGDFGLQDVSAQANAFADMTAEELRGVLRWAVTSFYLRPGHVGRLLRCTPWSTLARQGSSVLRAAFQAHT
jgi:radical SAM superfamily enzyme YgiQ (UPF0313 family)